MLIGMDRGDLQPWFVAHVELEGEILSMWISHLSGAFLIGGKLAAHLKFEGERVGVNVVHVAGPPPPLGRNPPPLAQIPLPQELNAWIHVLIFEALNEPFTDGSDSDDNDSCDSGGETTDT